jgi:hypothetical protein
MQTDMHYYGVFFLAYTAGLNPQTAHTIAYASQFTDDSLEDHVERNPKEGAAIMAEETAHHALDMENLEPEDQRFIWVPFHFLPGNTGASYHERLICRKDSAVAQEMLEHYLDNCQVSFAPQLFGIAAHVYADTFAHYGFSGVASKLNLAGRESLSYSIAKKGVQKYVDKKMNKFWDRFKDSLDMAVTNLTGSIAGNWTGGLGHAAAATLPDRPFINWELKYQSPDFTVKPPETRSNPDTYLEACEKLHSLFRRFALRRQDLSVEGQYIDFGQMRSGLSKVIRFEGNKEKRIGRWQKLWRDGDFTEQAGGAENAIPSYVPDDWHLQRESFKRMRAPKTMLKKKVYGFYQAASFHKHYVLRELLPSKGLIVI